MGKYTRVAVIVRRIRARKKCVAWPWPKTFLLLHILLQRRHDIRLSA